MDNWNRRQAIAGLVALSTLACSGSHPFGGGDPPKGDGRKGGGGRKGKDDRSPGAAAPADPAGMKGAMLFVPTGFQQFRTMKFADAPDWVRRNPGWWVPEAESGGSGLMAFINQADPDLPDRIKTFRDLPLLLEGARRLGTDAIYLTDWYNQSGASPDSAPPKYHGKGDYIARQDLGGPEGLKQGIAALKAAGGKIILYIDGFMIGQNSKIAEEHGREWAIKDEHGPIDHPYPTAYMLCPACKPWVEYITGVVERMVGEHGASGVYIDSIGIQKGYTCMDASHGHPVNDHKVFDHGCADMLRSMRSAIRAKDPESVLICEGPKLEALFEVVDGTLDWGLNRLVGRPMWDAVGETDIHTAGFSLDDMHQILALGSKVVLAEIWNQRPAGDSAVESLKKHMDTRIPDDTKAARMWMERLLQDFHKFRNAAIVLGLAVPGVDSASPRRGEDDEAFKDAEQIRAMCQELRGYATQLDQALAGKQPLGAPTDHIRKIVEARAALAPYCDLGGKVSEVTCSGAIAAWKFESPKGTAFTAVNVGNPAVSVDLPLTGSWIDKVSGETFSSANQVSLAGHTLRILIPA
jgi:hypothetical protein